VSRILIYEPNESHEPHLFGLSDKGREVVACHDRESLVGALSDRRPDVLVYAIRDLADDLVLLTDLRRIAPSLPIILLGGPIDLAMRRAIQELKPTYYGVLPLEGTELRDAVRGAVQRAVPHGRSGLGA